MHGTVGICEGQRFLAPPGAQITGGFRLPSVGAENQIPVLCMSNELLIAKPSLQPLQPN